MTQGEQPLYVSRRLPRNLWQEYRVYTDRIELRFRIGQKTIPANDIADVEVRPPIVIGDLFRGRGLRYSLALKVDLADFFRHVAIVRRTGWIKCIRFTPDAPDRFGKICRSLMDKKGLTGDDAITD